jgi:hypothetical protein
MLDSSGRVVQDSFTLAAIIEQAAAMGHPTAPS